MKHIRTRMKSDSNSPHQREIERGFVRGFSFFLCGGVVGLFQLAFHFSLPMFGCENPVLTGVRGLILGHPTPLPLLLLCKSWDWMNVKICHLSKQYLYFYYEVKRSRRTLPLKYLICAPSKRGRLSPFSCNMTRKCATHWKSQPEANRKKIMNTNLFFVHQHCSRRLQSLSKIGKCFKNK